MYQKRTAETDQSLLSTSSFSCKVLSRLIKAESTGNGGRRKSTCPNTMQTGHKYGLAITMLGRACLIEAVSILCYKSRLNDAGTRPHGICDNNDIPRLVFRLLPEKEKREKVEVQSGTCPMSSFRNTSLDSSQRLLCRISKLFGFKTF